MIPLEEIRAITEGGKLVNFAVVLVALCGLVILVGNVVDAVRKLRKPQERKEENLQTHQEACRKMFSADKRLLEDHDRRIDALEEGQCVICAALHELLEHELHNGNADKMQRASSDLFDYLNERRRS